MKKCLACSSEIPAGAKYCPSCGTGSCCPQCGCADIGAEHKFCPECGEALVQQSMSVSQQCVSSDLVHEKNNMTSLMGSGGFSRVSAQPSISAPKQILSSDNAQSAIRNKQNFDIEKLTLTQENSNTEYQGLRCETDMPMIGFTEAIKRCFSKYIKFDGRATRAEYWWWNLFLFLTLLLASMLAFNLRLPVECFYIFVLAILMPGIAVSVRRLHDIDFNGAWFFLNCVPYVGFVVFFLLMILPGKAAPNRFGEREAPMCR